MCFGVTLLEQGGWTRWPLWPLPALPILWFSGSVIVGGTDTSVRATYPIVGCNRCKWELHDWGIACTKCNRYRWAIRLTCTLCGVLCCGPVLVTAMWSLLPLGHWLLIIAFWLLTAGKCQIQSSFQQEKPSLCGKSCNSKGEDTQKH